MNQLLLEISPSVIDWSRAQFALTAAYHWLFVPLTLGLAVIMGIAETIYYKNGDPSWRDTARFWQKLFGINFAIGVATGIILEFEFGTNWSNYSWFVGDIFGAPLAIEGIVAFFMESTFVAVMFFGWKKVSRGSQDEEHLVDGHGRHHLGMVDTRGKRMDAVPRRPDLQPRHDALRDDELRRRGPVAVCR